MDELIFLPCRTHEEDLVAGPFTVDASSYQRLNLSPVILGEVYQSNGVNHEAALAWFQETWATRLNTEGEAVVVTSRIHEEEGGQEG